MVGLYIESLGNAQVSILGILVAQLKKVRWNSRMGAFKYENMEWEVVGSNDTETVGASNIIKKPLHSRQMYCKSPNEVYPKLYPVHFSRWLL